MKQKDIALIIIVAAISGFASLFISRLVFAKPAAREQKVEIVDAISSEFPKPSEKYFNNTSINAARLIIVTDNNNPNPFGGAR